MHTDGNELSGVLDELFCAEMSTALRRCPSCWEMRMVAEHMLYHGAGSVLRCPGCGDLAAAVIERAGGYAVTLRGTWLLSRAG
jgi:ribosomal protein S27E